MAWAKIIIRLKPWIPQPKCELCGRPLKDGETAYRRVKLGRVARKRKKGNPAVVGYMERDIFRCRACYKLLWR